MAESIENFFKNTYFSFESSLLTYLLIGSLIVLQFIFAVLYKF